LLSKELSPWPSQEGHQEPGPTHGPGRSRISITGYSVGPLAGSPSTAPRGGGNGGRGRFRPHTLLSFEGASPLRAASTSPRGSAWIPNRPARPARRVQVSGPGTLRTT